MAIQSINNWSIWIKKTNALLNSIQKQSNGSSIDKIYLYVKDLSEPKYQFLIKKCKDRCRD